MVGGGQIVRRRLHKTLALTLIDLQKGGIRAPGRTLHFDKHEHAVAQGNQVNLSAGCGVASSNERVAFVEQIGGGHVFGLATLSAAIRRHRSD